MNQENIKRNNNLHFVRYTLSWGLILGFVLLFAPMGHAQTSPFENLIISLRNPFILGPKKKRTVKTAKKEGAPVQSIVGNVAPERPVFKDPVIQTPLPEVKVPAQPEIKLVKPVVIKPKLPEMRVTGLIFKTDHPQAIVNGKIVEPGDIIEDVKILKIKEGGLLLKYKNKIHFLKYSNK